MPRGKTSFLIGIFLSAFVLWLVPRQNLEAHLKSTRCKRGCVTCYMCPAGAVMGQDEVFGRHRPNSRLVLPTKEDKQVAGSRGSVWVRPRQHWRVPAGTSRLLLRATASL